MAAIRSKDTKPEVLVRRYLFGRGLRFRIHVNNLPGHPDIVLPKYKTVVFVNGCFWHGHDGCRHSHLPATNTDFWEAKITRNKERDAAQEKELTAMGWRVIRVWECEIKRAADREARLAALYTEITAPLRTHTGANVGTHTGASGVPEPTVCPVWPHTGASGVPEPAIAAEPAADYGKN